MPQGALLVTEICRFGNQHTYSTPAVDYCTDRNVIKALDAASPGQQVAVLSIALGVEAINLHGLSALTQLQGLCTMPQTNSLLAGIIWRALILAIISCYKIP
jgi:hypothetical protein